MASDTYKEGSASDENVGDTSLVEVQAKIADAKYLREKAKQKKKNSNIFE